MMMMMVTMMTAMIVLVFVGSAAGRYLMLGLAIPIMIITFAGAAAAFALIFAHQQNKQALSFKVSPSHDAGADAKG